MRIWSVRNQLWFLPLLLSSCSYEWHAPESSCRTLSVPFISGDSDGSFTSALVHSLSCAGISVVHSGASRRLEVKIFEGSSDVIGYRIDPQKIRGKIKHNILACEGRRNLSVEVALYSSGSEVPLWGPHQIAANVDYDYVDGDSYQDLTFVNSQGQRVPVLSFSLGQLESSESAQAAANRPLYTTVIQKIVDSISCAW